MIRSLARKLLGPRRAGRPVQEPVAPNFPADPYVAQQRLLQGVGISDPVIFDIGVHKGTAALA